VDAEKTVTLKPDWAKVRASQGWFPLRNATNRRPKLMHFCFAGLFASRQRSSQSRTFPRCGERLRERPKIRPE
jgi:hypothetical protein